VCQSQCECHTAEDPIAVGETNCFLCVCVCVCVVCGVVWCGVDM
jgi:hypothetical protein